MGDSNFQFFAELTVPPQAAGVVDMSNVLCPSENYGLLFSPFDMPYYLYNVSFYMYISIISASMMCLKRQ